MSLGGMTTIALADHAPDLVRKVVLVDVTPGVNERKSSTIAEFINGPESFDSFDDLLARTIEYNPTRTEASLRRGILHNAEQREDGSWVWRYQRFRAFEPERAEGEPSHPNFQYLWDAVSRIQVPVLLARGMREQSVVDDDDEVELLRRLPNAQVEHFEDAGPQPPGRHPRRARPEHRARSSSADASPELASTRAYSTVPQSTQTSLLELVEEADDGVVEEVVLVARDHVTGALDVDVLGVRHQSEQVLRALFAEQVAHPAAHEQRGDRDVLRGVLEPTLVHERRAASRRASRACPA